MKRQSGDGRTPWQKKMLSEGRCVLCGKKAAVKVLNLCQQHRKERVTRSLKRYYIDKLEKKDVVKVSEPTASGQ